jgi:hypothetical protein
VEYEYEYVTTPTVVEEVVVAEGPEEVGYEWQQNDLPASPWHAQWGYPGDQDDLQRIGHAG